MTEDELRVVMRYAGVSSGEGGGVTPPNDDDAGGEGAGSSSDVRRRNSLVKIFVESGRVRLVPRGGTTATATASERRSGGATAKERGRRTTPKKEAATAPPPSSSSRTSEDVGEDDGGEGSPMRRASSSALTAATNVVAGGNQNKNRPSMNASENSLMARMSKLEKITELKAEIASVKTENKSLKKTVKKLLGQLTDAIAEKNELLLLPSRQPQEQEQQQQQQQPEQQQQQQHQPTTSSVDGIPSTHGDDAQIKTLAPLSPIEELRGDSMVEGDASRTSRDGEKGGEDDVVVVAVAAVCPFPIPSPDDDVDTSARSGSISSRLSEVLGSVESSEKLTSSSKSSKENITLLMQKLKKEKQAHENTEFRLKVKSLRVRRIAGSHVVRPYRDPRLIALLFFDRPSSLTPAVTIKKAELDILTNEVKGLQRELGLALRSLDDAKERARESRESTHCLRRELRDANARLKESSAEAEARDRLIETFKGILLQKVGLPIIISNC